MDPTKPVVERARDQLRNHFNRRKAERKEEQISEWKEEGVYPYSGPPESAVERVERQVFDAVALEVNSRLPEFPESSVRNRELSFRLLRQALESDPGSLQKILREVLQLPPDRQDEFAELLERTSLKAIISAAKVVADRLDFLEGLKKLVFEPGTKEHVKERSQLHRIVAEHTWLFGERFNLSVSDRDLTQVLKKHVELHERELLDESPVTRADGRRGIVDLMFSRRIPQPDSRKREHLVVELKAPDKKIDPSAVQQTKDYAFACADDERFRDVETKWTWWALSTDVHQHVERDSRQENRPRGLLHESGNMEIWVKTWSEVINEAQARLSFFQEQLNYHADDESALSILKRLHEEHLPEMVLAEK